MSRFHAFRLVLSAALTTLVLAYIPVVQSQDAATSESDSDDWNWDNFAPADDGPTVRSSKVIKRDSPAAADAVEVPRVGETAAPDFEAEVHQAYELFPGAPAFAVVPSVRDRDMHPCGNCHAWAQSDPTPRDLKKPHDNFALQHGLHGKGGFWCFSCHTLEGGSGALRTLEGETLDFNEAYVLCSQCHVKEARDWVYGAHGKRVANWQGERKVYNCTVCHYQHRPAIKAREAMAGPLVRQGIEHPDHWVPMNEREHPVHTAGRPWEKHAETGSEMEGGK